MSEIIIFFKILLSITTKRNKIIFIVSSIITVCAHLIQTVGLMVAIPFLTTIINQNIIFENKYIYDFYTFFNFTDNINFIIFLGISFISLVGFGNLILGISNYLQVYSIQKITRDVQNKLLNYYFHRNYSELKNLDTSKDKSNLIISNDLDMKFLFPITEIIPKIILLFILITISLVIFLEFTLIGMFLILIISLIIQKILKKSLYVAGIEIEKSNYKITKLIFNSFQIIKIIVLDNLQNFFLKKFQKENYNLIKHHSFSHFVSQSPKLVLEFLMTLFVVTISLILFFNETQNLIPTISFFAIFGYKIFPNLSHIYGYYNTAKSRIKTFKYIKKDLLRIKKIKNFEKDFTFKDPLKKIHPKKNIKMSFDAFGYYKNRIILKKQTLNFDVEKLNVIHGRTGSGKTTLINLLMGFIKNKNVKIKLDDNLLSEDKKNNLLEKISLVPQKIELIDASIKKNILFDKKISTKDFNKICKISNLDKYIKSLPEKENTIIGENFQKISGGQAQRISIARSLVKKPKILILDEGTGQIDKITETYILKNLLKLKITIILITHRIDYLKNFKKIKTFIIYKGLIKETNN
jgi:ATP-binding cassette, subfamily B, bacterial PglK